MHSRNFSEVAITMDNTYIAGMFIEQEYCVLYVYYPLVSKRNDLYDRNVHFSRGMPNKVVLKLQKLLQHWTVYRKYL